MTAVTLPAEGTYVFRATVAGALRANTDDVAVTRIAAPAENATPTAGLAETAAGTLPEPIPLAASVADPDSQPGALRVKWARVSGPGGVWFEPPFAAATRATFTVAGTYVLACTVSDGDRGATAQTTVTVSADAASPGLTNGLIMSVTGDEGSPRREGVSGNLCVDNANYSTTFYADGKVGYGFKATGARAYFSTGMQMPETAANTVWGYFPDGEGKELSRAFPGIVDEVRVWNRKLSPAEIRQLAAEPVSMNNRAPQVTVSPAGGPDSKIVRNRPMTFTAMAFDDGLPLGASLTYDWQVVVGNAAAVTFSAQNAAATQVTVNGTGAFAFRVKVTDGDLTAYSEAQRFEVVSAGTAILIL